MSALRVKICGITRQSDALFALKQGADALGFIFAKSPRRVTVAGAKKIIRSIRGRAMAVGVFVDEKAANILKTAKACGLDAIQLHGQESEALLRLLQKNGLRVIRALRVSAAGDVHLPDTAADAILLDTAVSGRHGGTGVAFDWKKIKGLQLDRPWLVSGGLNPKNVKTMLKILKPYGVDASSGLESAPGKKSKKLMKEFIRNANPAR